MDEERTIKNIESIRHHLRIVVSDLIFVGRYSDHVYQAKFERYEREISKVIDELLCDEYR